MHTRSLARNHALRYTDMHTQIRGTKAQQVKLVGLYFEKIWLSHTDTHTHAQMSCTTTLTLYTPPHT